VSILAIIPARSGSKGIPGKNWRKLGEKTLVQRACNVAHEAGCQTVVTSSDDWSFTDTYRMTGRTDVRLARPAELAQDDTPMIAVVKHVLESVPGPDDQIVVLLQPTQPFRTARHIICACELLRERHGEQTADSVVSVAAIPLSHHADWQFECQPYANRQRLRSVVWRTRGPDHPMTPTRRQDMPPAYIRDGTVYAFWRKTVTRYGNMYGHESTPLIIPPEETCELDTMQDWANVERRWSEREA
jgi:CMP-N,N'-diacetyllegionaminic acid synthase